jgi:hypothetical protein
VLAGRVAKSVNMGNGKLEKEVQWNVCKPTPEFSRHSVTSDKKPIFTLFATRPASTGQKIYFGIFNKHIGRNLDLFYR